MGKVSLWVKATVCLRRSAPFREIENILRLVVELHLGSITGQPAINKLRFEKLVRCSGVYGRWGHSGPQPYEIFF